MVFWSRAGWAKAWRLGSQRLSEVEGRGRRPGGWQAHHGKPSLAAGGFERPRF